MVAASNFHNARSFGFLVGPDYDVLARRSEMVRSTVKLPRHRRFLCGVDSHIARRRATWTAKGSQSINLSAASDWDCCFVFHCVGWIFGVAFASVRFRQLH